MVTYRSGYRFLADAEVNRALDLVRRVKADDLLFDPADQVHRSIKSGGGIVDTLFHLVSQECLEIEPANRLSRHVNLAVAVPPIHLGQPLRKVRAGAPSEAREPGAVEQLARCAIRLARIEGQLASRSEEHTSELQSQFHLVCRLLLEKKKKHYHLQLTIKKIIKNL